MCFIILFYPSHFTNFSVGNSFSTRAPFSNSESPIIPFSI